MRSLSKIDGGFNTRPRTNNLHAALVFISISSLSQPKLRTCQTDNFHIRHMLPAGDSL
ncbi:unnamed protein product [Rhodiola kirilowii]